jgi:hypothetical protein
MYENIKLIVSVGCVNDCLNEINLVDEYENKVLCHILDTKDYLPDKHLYGKPKKSILYQKLYKVKPLEEQKEKKGFLSFFSQQEKVKEERIYNYDNFSIIEYLINNNENVLLLYTDDYLEDIIKLLKRIKLENLLIIKKQ